jgi:hypothetical protein
MRRTNQHPIGITMTRRPIRIAMTNIETCIIIGEPIGIA